MKEGVQFFTVQMALCVVGHLAWTAVTWGAGEC